MTRLQTSSLQTEYQTAIQKFGEGYVDFLKKYPTLRRRQELLLNPYEAVSKGGMSFVQLDNYFSKGASEWWIKVMLIDLFTFLGAMENVTAFQVKGMATRIRQEYYYMTPAEFTFFLCSYSMGDYGKLYNGKNINPQDVLIALRDCNEKLRESRIEWEKEQKQLADARQAEQDRRESVSFDKWKEISGKPSDYKSPLDRLKESINKQ